MQQIFAFLQGKKTYIIVAVGALIWSCYQLGYIPQGVEVQLLQLLGLGAVATIRNAITTAQQ